MFWRPVGVDPVDRVAAGEGIEIGRSGMTKWISREEAAAAGVVIALADAVETSRIEAAALPEETLQEADRFRRLGAVAGQHAVTASKGLRPDHGIVVALGAFLSIDMGDDVPEMIINQWEHRTGGLGDQCFEAADSIKAAITTIEVEAMELPVALVVLLDRNF